MDDDELTRRVCAILGTVPTWAYRPDGSAFLPREVGIVYGAVPTSPDRAIGVRVYDGDDLPGLHERRLQLHFRGAPGVAFDADRIAGIAFTVLQGLSRRDGISDARRVSFAPLGADGNRREERTDNYLITLDNTEASS